MAQYALPPGAIRRRAVFGLLDADGWAWAALKATFWFIFIIFVLGYVPDRAYYFTVSPTIDLGFNAISPINLCPADNQGLPCPAPAGAVIPWQSSPPELALPQTRSGASTFASGTNLYLVGGTSGGQATASVLTTTVTDNNLTKWTDGPALPAPRTGATLLTLSGVPYVIGGSDASGAPQSTVFIGTVANGALTGWTEDQALALPAPLTDAAGGSTASGLYVFGGRTTGNALSAATYHTSLPTGQTKLGPWQEMTEVPLPEARAGATAVSSGISIYVLGGEGPNGVSNSVFYLGLDSKGSPAVDPNSHRPFGWGVSVNQSAAAALPDARVHATSFGNGGAVYVIGGQDASGATVATNYWTVPNATNGVISAWQRLDPTDLPSPRAGAAAAAVGSDVFLIGGNNGSAELNDTLRADLAPRLPFFRAGLFGVTVPALSIKGEIGQQLGYIIAAGAGTGGLIALILIGWMFSHRRESYRFFQWASRGRFRAPPEDDYTY
jgi:hypothetical protein